MSLSHLSKAYWAPPMDRGCCGHLRRSDGQDRRAGCSDAPPDPPEGRTLLGMLLAGSPQLSALFGDCLSYREPLPSRSQLQRGAQSPAVCVLTWDKAAGLAHPQNSLRGWLMFLMNWLWCVFLLPSPIPFPSLPFPRWGS